MKIEGMAPINSTAARVTGKGFQYTPDKKITCTHSDVPLPIIRIGWNEEDITGIKQGRLTVIGKFSKGAGKKASMWAVRCQCGNYETRSRKALLNPANNQDCCQQCRHVEHLKRVDSMRDKYKTKTALLGKEGV